MNKQPLFLSLNGFHQLSHQQQKKPLTANWKLSSSSCLITRDCYWEYVAYYPTTNIIEVYKIIAAEIDQISPFPGKTTAFIVNLSQNKAVVLYCCFLDTILAKAAPYNLWRLVPETLPLYRALFGDNKIFYTDATFSSVNIISANSEPEKSTSPTEKFESNKQLNNQLIIKIDANKLASLPQNLDTTMPFSDAMLNEAQLIKNETYHKILTRYRALDVLDFTVQAADFIKNSFLHYKHLSSIASIFCVSLILTFIMGKSAFLLWQHDHLSNEISLAKANAFHSVGLSNDLKKIKLDIKNINEHLNEHGTKTQLFKLLKKLANNDNKLVFKTINISPAEIQLHGTITSAAALLADLSKIKGFSQVQFNTPPATKKDIGENFNINVVYDQQIYSNKSTKITP